MASPGQGYYPGGGFQPSANFPAAPQQYYQHSQQPPPFQPLQYPHQQSPIQPPPFYPGASSPIVSPATAGPVGLPAAASPQPVSMCQMCRATPANQGFALCSRCHACPSACTNCMVNAPSPGKRWCQQCFLQKKAPVQVHHSSGSPGAAAMPPHHPHQQLHHPPGAKPKSGPPKPCLNCQTAPKAMGTPLCATCLHTKPLFFEQMHPAHPKYPGIRRQFETTWTAWGNGKHPVLEKVFAVFNYTSFQRYEQYKQQVAHRNGGNPNERRMYHGCPMECPIFTTGQFCASKSCVACNICRQGFQPRPTNFNTLQFGNGFYFAFNSSKSDKFARGSEVIPKIRVLLVCKVVVGREHELDHDVPNLPGPPAGYDSVLAVPGPKANVTEPEVIVYNTDAALPAYVLVYRV